jgi:cell division initiation protein
MNVTPLDLRQTRFRSAVRGFDRNEVTAFLSEVADQYEEALRETDRLRQELVRSEAIITEHREHERNLRNTLMTAQRLADEIRGSAEQEAKRVLREAEGRAELLMQKTQARLEDVQREIDGLRLKRHDAENALESTIASLRNALEYIREQDQRDRNDRPGPWPKSSDRAAPAPGAAPAPAPASAPSAVTPETDAPADPPRKPLLED